MRFRPNIDKRERASERGARKTHYWTWSRFVLSRTAWINSAAAALKWREKNEPICLGKQESADWRQLHTLTSYSARRLRASGAVGSRRLTLLFCSATRKIRWVCCLLMQTEFSMRTLGPRVTFWRRATICLIGRHPRETHGSVGIVQRLLLPYMPPKFSLSLLVATRLVC
jgi:hypothetical protein